MKHGQSTHVWVSLDRKEDKLTLMIGDNGMGFDVEKFKNTHSHTSLGIYGMSERVALVDGSFEITSVIGQGTQIFVQIPLIEK